MKFELQIPLENIRMPANDAIKVASSSVGARVREGDRPPQAIFANCADKVLRRFNMFLSALEEVETGSLDEIDQALDGVCEEMYDNLLDALVEFCEDHQRILESFESLSSNGAFKSHLSNYKRTVRPFRDHVASSVNFLKHNQGRIKLMHATSEVHGHVVGYYVEGTAAEGVIGPAAKIHHHQAARSFNWDLRFNFIGLFFVSQCLRTFLIGLLGKKWTQDPVLAKRDPLRESGMDVLAKRISARPRVFFSSEKTPTFPEILVRVNHFNLRYLEYPRRAAFIEQARIRSSFQIPGDARTYQLPFL